MTVNERLYVAGLFHEFDDAVNTKDRERVAAVLEKIYLPTDPEYIELLITVSKLAPQD